MMDRRGSCWLALRMGRSRGRKGAAFVVVGSGGADCMIPHNYERLHATCRCLVLTEGSFRGSQSMPVTARSSLIQACDHVSDHFGYQPC
jgi:multimeric flavodoxin WrbA